VVAKGRVFVGSADGDGKIYCFGTESQPPNTPTINGPANGKPGISVEYKLVSDDPNYDNVRYIISWGDGKSETTGYYPSGEDVNASHIWNGYETYIIKVIAEDTFGIKSLPATFSVTMPVNKIFYSSFFDLVENFTKLFPILQKILDRTRQ
jgi:hypothetical protein